MSIVASEIRARGCSNDTFGATWVHIEDDVTVAGGPIADPDANLSKMIMIGGWLSEGIGQSLIIKSSNAGDTTQTCIIRARHSNGTLATSDTATFNGTNSVGILFNGGAGDQSVERIEWVRLSNSTFAGVVEIDNQGNGVHLIDMHPATTDEFYTTRLFINSFSTTAGITRYDKFFWRNAYNGAALTALTPTYRLTADPEVRIRQGISSSKNDSATIANRVTAPAGVTFVDDNVDQIGSDLLTSDNQGVWIEFASTANDPNAPFNDTFTSQVTVGTI